MMISWWFMWYPYWWGLVLVVSLGMTTVTGRSSSHNRMDHNNHDDHSFQPHVIPVEVDTARRNVGSLSQPGGSPWCPPHNTPAVWMVGHQPGHTDRPWCLEVSSSRSNHHKNFDDCNYTQSVWKRSPTTVLDRQDVLNQQDEGTGHVRNLDRHDCVATDVNGDGTPDIVCGVGANNGQGRGYNEVYLTNSNGQLIKTLYGHGLNRWPTMRNRYVTTLQSATDGATLVLFAVKGVRRTDGQSNIHRMYKLDQTPTSPQGFSFRHVPGPWNRHTTATCLHTVDINQDGWDDVVMCQQKRMGRIFLQQANGTFSQARYANMWAYDWRNVRVADVTGDGINDIIVVGRTAPNRFASSSSTTRFYYVRVFQGIPREPFFQFSRHGVWYERILSYAAPDVEVLDVNHDGTADLYIVQTDELRRGGYCGRNFDKTQWWGSNLPQPPASFVPPSDQAQDLLLVGTTGRDAEEAKFREVPMDHAVAGCGALVERFGNNYTIVLSHGTFDRPGYTVLLQW